MRVGILFAQVGNSTVCRELAAALGEGVQAQGHDVELINMHTDAARVIAFYDYIAVGTESVSFLGGKIPDAINQFLRQSGTVSGKRCFAFISKKGLRKGKTLQKLMHSMESQGMYLTFSEVLTSRTHAKEVGKRLVISYSGVCSS